MKKYGIPTADYAVFSDPKEVVEYVEKRGKFPVVIKADGLALGKGVIIAQNFDEAKDAVHTIMEDKVFGASGNNVVVEEFLTGPEVSVLAFTDGKTLRPMVSSKDHKRALDGDKGLNTGGMGTISPNPYYTNEIADECMKTIFLPTVKAMQAEGRPFKGCLYFGLMLTPDGPKVIEYNARFGDPETQVVLPRLKNDLVEVMLACANCKLDQIELDWRDEWAVAVVLTSAGYPGSYEKGKVITGIEDAEAMENVTVYHAGTAVVDGQLVTNGGRVLAVTALGDTFENARNLAYEACEKIDFEGKTLRHDIGLRALRGRDAWDA
jgi:phosphoribosylamine--glycine ligase